MIALSIGNGITGGKMAGGFFAIRAAKEDGPLYVAEGYATAVTVHMATGCTVLAGFNRKFQASFRTIFGNIRESVVFSLDL